MPVKKNSLPIADMRGVTFDGIKYSRKTGSLCERCGDYEICLRNYNVNECLHFVPIIPFRPPFKGMESFFNTMRIGTAWVKRTKPGRKVALQNAKTKAIFGTAMVEDVFSGYKPTMAAIHGIYNHNYVNEQVTPEQITVLMQRRLRQSYGNMIYESSEDVSVIYLKRE